MALWKNVVLFSQVRGVVLRGGAPLAGAEIVQEVTWSADAPEITGRATTDAAGRFTLPKVERKSVAARFVPHEPVVKQRLLIRHGGEEHEGWAWTKQNYDDNGELNRPLVLSCDVGAKPQYSGDWYGVCRIDR